MADEPETLRLHSDAIWREADGEMLGLDPSLRNYVSANESGSMLWRLLAAGTTRDRLIHALVAEYGIDEAQASADVDAFVADLRANDFLAG